LLHKRPIIIITGSRKGIGKCFAEYYIDKGFQVLGCSRSHVDFQVDNYQHFCLDVSDERSVKEMFSEIRKTYGRLDVLINNAGITSMNYALLTPISTSQEVINTNVLGTILFCREAVKLMRKKQYGRIVNISSIHVPLCSIGTSLYGGSKAFVEQFSSVMAREVFPLGITINTLALSVVKDSGMTEILSDKAEVEILLGSISKSRLEFQDVAHAVNFLISRKSKMVTSQIIYLGGV